MTARIMIVEEKQRARNGFLLQSASTPAGPWVSMQGPIVTSPFVTNFAGSATFYRLKK